jgi:epoxyqueuosine reductase
MNLAPRISSMIKEEAIRLGFADCGISKVTELAEDARRLDSWLENGYHAGMEYMARNREKRIDPGKLVEGSKSVISVLLNYYPPEIQKDPEAPVVAKYAYGMDYHKVVKNKLHLLFNYIKEIQPGTKGRVFTDSAPVMERIWAQRSGLGWIGKNSLLLSSKHGSFLFIGELMVNIELEYDTPVNELCGSCRRCIDACPTGAIIAEKVVDARKCISYHTIENKTEQMPTEFKDRFLKRIFGCDICQDVCPWNKKPTPHNVEEFMPNENFITMNRKDWLEMDLEKYKKLFAYSAVSRAGFKGLRRNIGFVEGD